MPDVIKNIYNRSIGGRLIAGDYKGAAMAIPETLAIGASAGAAGSGLAAGIGGAGAAGAGAAGTGAAGAGAASAGGAGALGAAGAGADIADLTGAEAGAGVLGPTASGTTTAVTPSTLSVLAGNAEKFGPATLGLASSALSSPTPQSLPAPQQQNPFAPAAPPSSFTPSPDFPTSGGVSSFGGGSSGTGQGSDPQSDLIQQLIAQFMQQQNGTQAASGGF